MFGCGKVLKQVDDNKSEYQLIEQTYIPAGFSIGSPKTMYVIGNSVSLHGPDASMGWYLNNGMSATTVNADYVHQLARMLSVNVTVENRCADVEKNFDTFDFSTIPTADLVVFQLGDNMNGKYLGFADKLAGYITSNPDCKVIILSTCLNTNKYTQAVCDELLRAATIAKAPFIDIRQITQDKSNVGFEQHPNDKGMLEIANKIYGIINQ